MFLAAPFQQTDRSRKFLQTVLRVFGRARLSAKEVAALQGLTEPQWSVQVRGEGAHVSFQRVGDVLLSKLEWFDWWLTELHALREELRAAGDSDEDIDVVVRRWIDRAQVAVLQMELLERQLKKPMAKAQLAPAEAKEKLA